MKGTNIYALSQPTDAGIIGVLDAIRRGRADKTEDRVTWVNLREEVSQPVPSKVGLNHFISRFVI